MSRGYGQYCPLSLAAELLGQRWTILVVSRLLDGCTRFNEIRRGVPRISPTLLSKRLAELEDAGLLVTTSVDKGPGSEYHLTRAGRDLGPIIDQMAVWGQQWARDMSLDDLDPAFLVWSMHLRIDTETLPTQRVVLEFDFSGAPDNCQRFWLICRREGVEMCLKDPDLDIDLLVTADLRLFVESWRGFRDLREEIELGRIRILGPEKLVEEFPNWLLLSSLASTERRREGAERRLAEESMSSRRK